MNKIHKQSYTAHKLETCCGGTADSKAITSNILDKQRYKIVVLSTSGRFVLRGCK